MIDICDFAVGLSRQLYGLTIASERPGHRLMEKWHPLGPDRPSSPRSTSRSRCGRGTPPSAWCAATRSSGSRPTKTPLTAVACTALLRQLRRSDEPALHGLAPGRDRRPPRGRRRWPTTSGCPLVSATGSTRMGREVGPRVAARFGRSLLELGGNNAMIVAPSADLELARRAIVFSAVGTAGQRCTSLRRLIAHRVRRTTSWSSRWPRPTPACPSATRLEDGHADGPADRLRPPTPGWKRRSTRRSEQGGERPRRRARAGGPLARTRST